MKLKEALIAPLLRARCGNIMICNQLLGDCFVTVSPGICSLRYATTDIRVLVHGTGPLPLCKHASLSSSQ